MNPRKHFPFSAILAAVLAVVCLVLAVVVGIDKPVYLLAVAGVFVVLLLLAFVFMGRLRRAVRKMLSSGRVREEAVGGGLANLSAPVAVIDKDQIVWYNAAFQREMSAGAEVIFYPVKKVLPDLDLRLTMSSAGQDIAVGRRRYTAYSNVLANEKTLSFVLFVENTALKTQAAEYVATRPSVLYFMIDTYDELLKEMRESKRANMVSNIEIALEEYIGKANGFFRRVSSSQFVAVVEERYMRQMVAERFSVLDEIRKMWPDSSAVTLSIGAGRKGATFKDCEEMAMAALDMALGRGGDQAAVKSPDGFEFYGGLSTSVERHTKVKSRIIAAAVRDLVLSSERVFIMGHKDSDMDAIGAAVGMLRFCQICGRLAHIVVDEERTLAGLMLDKLHENGYSDRILSPEDAAGLAGPRSLLVVVDTHMIRLLESEELYEICGNTVVIDHHRRMVGYIDDAVVFYHEPAASSASELVTEMLQYAGESKEEKLTALEAEMLLAGIMLDTRTFSLNVGVRTFEAAAWLRGMGAKTAEVKKIFAISMDDYLYRCHLVSEARMHMGCAISVSDQVPMECEVTAPQAANELLGIGGVQASLVGIKQGNQVRISARSMGGVNVQLIMEKLGGGGHLTMAGAQLKDVNCDEAREMMMRAVEEYWAENGKKA